MSQQSSELARIADRVAAIRAEVDAAAARTRSRVTTMWIIAVVALVVSAGYLTWAYKQIASMNADDAVGIAAVQLKDRLPSAGAELASHLRAEAPRLTQQLEKTVIDIPVSATTMLRSTLREQWDVNLKKLEEETTATFKAYLATFPKSDAKPGGDTGRLDSAKSEIATSFRNDAIKALDGFYARYTEGSTELIEYLTRLSENRDLDRKGQLHREIMRNFIALMQHPDTAKEAGISIPQ